MWTVLRQRVTRLKTDFHNKLSIQLIWRNIIGNSAFVHASLQKIVSYKLEPKKLTKQKTLQIVLFTQNITWQNMLMWDIRTIINKAPKQSMLSICGMAIIPSIP